MTSQQEDLQVHSQIAWPNFDYAVTAAGMDPTEASTAANRMASGTPVTASQMYIRASPFY